MAPASDTGNRDGVGKVPATSSHGYRVTIWRLVRRTLTERGSTNKIHGVGTCAYWRECYRRVAGSRRGNDENRRRGIAVACYVLGGHIQINTLYAYDGLGMEHFYPNHNREHRYQGQRDERPQLLSSGHTNSFVCHSVLLVVPSGDRGRKRYGHITSDD